MPNFRFVHPFKKKNDLASTLGYYQFRKSLSNLFRAPDLPNRKEEGGLQRVSPWNDYHYFRNQHLSRDNPDDFSCIRFSELICQMIWIWVLPRGELLGGGGLVDRLSSTCFPDQGVSCLRSQWGAPLLAPAESVRDIERIKVIGNLPSSDS